MRCIGVEHRHPINRELFAGRRSAGKIKMAYKFSSQRQHIRMDKLAPLGDLWRDCQINANTLPSTDSECLAPAPPPAEQVEHSWCASHHLPRSRAVSKAPSNCSSNALA